MKNFRVTLSALSLALVFTVSTHAQAPAGSTGQCNDGTYSTAASKAGACAGHKGVKTWFAAATPKAAAVTPPVAANKSIAPAKAVAPTPTPSTTPMVASKPAPAAPATTAPAAGGGPGMVWVNTESKVYHCPGGRYYGKTKQGKYMTEAAAKAMGARPDANKPCK